MLPVSESPLPFCISLQQEHIRSTVERNDGETILRFNIQKDGYLEAKFVPEMNTSMIIELTLEHRARANIGIYYHGKRHSTFYCKTLQHHIGHQSKSTVEVRFAGEDEASIDYIGKIEIPEGIRDAKVTQKNKNLIFSESVQVHAEPNMDIRSKDVACSHGTAIGNIDPDILHYCSLRGISETIAKTLLIEGFLDLKK